MVLFIVGCAGSVLLCGLFASCRGHSLVMVGGASLLWCLLLWCMERVF